MIQGFQKGHAEHLLHAALAQSIFQCSIRGDSSQSVGMLLTGKQTLNYFLSAVTA